MLREANERRHTKGIFAALNAANRFRVNPNQLGEAFLRQIRPQAGGGHILADDAQESFVRHAPLRSV